jgi:F-type H+-transporting ATPase subunit b
MKKRLFIASVAGALLLTFGMAGSASASGETLEGCLLEEWLEEKGHLDGGHGDEHSALHDEELLKEIKKKCIEAPSPIIPELNEIIWGGGAFLVLLALMLWKGFPAVKKIMDERSEKIASDLDQADQAKVDARAVKTQYEAELADAKSEASRIIEEARQQAESLRADLQARAETDIAEMRTQASADLEAARERAMGDLQAEVADIVVGAAERVVEANLDAEAQTRLIENYINQIGSE